LTIDGDRMSIEITGGDFAENMLERRWFASMAAARAKQAECQALLEVVAIARASWRDSRAELTNLEALRDALGEKMAELAAERAALRDLFADEADAENRGPEAIMNPSNVWSAA
jgi:hypothetical protein